MRSISLTKGYSTVVNNCDFKWLSQWNWCAKTGPNGPYAVRGIKKCGKTTIIRMHRAIAERAGLGSPLHVDHRNGDGLDNRRRNLRATNAKGNNGNRRPNRNGSSRFKGVAWHTQRKKWRARITRNGKSSHLGLFTSEIKAAEAYNKAARAYFGTFARLNVV